jgi:hypothetical protein
MLLFTVIAVAVTAAKKLMIFVKANLSARQIVPGITWALFPGYGVCCFRCLSLL